jgi:hypothetical protein
MLREGGVRLLTIFGKRVACAVVVRGKRVDVQYDVGVYGSFRCGAQSLPPVEVHGATRTVLCSPLRRRFPPNVFAAAAAAG